MIGNGEQTEIFRFISDVLLTHQSILTSSSCGSTKTSDYSTYYRCYRAWSPEHKQRHFGLFGTTIDDHIRDHLNSFLSNSFSHITTSLWTGRRSSLIYMLPKKTKTACNEIWEMHKNSGFYFLNVFIFYVELNVVCVEVEPNMIDDIRV